MQRVLKEIVDDIVNYHFSNQEHILADLLIKENSRFAEALCFELEMQMQFKNHAEQQEMDLEETE